MSLRRIVDALVGADGRHAADADPDGSPSRAALEEAGHGALDAELYGEALVHYAEAAPLEVADAMAPIVATASAVPLDPDLDPVGPHDDGTGLDDDAAAPGEDEPGGDPGADGSDPEALDDTATTTTDDDPGASDADRTVTHADDGAPAPSAVVDDGYGRGSSATVERSVEQPGGDEDGAQAETGASVTVGNRIGLDDPDEPDDPDDPLASVETFGDENWLDEPREEGDDDAPGDAGDPDLLLDD